MSKLLDLVAKLESIPTKERHADVVGGLTKLCEAVERGAADATDLLSAARNATAVTGRDEYAAVGIAAQRVVGPARRMRRNVERKPEEAWSKRGDDLMITIGDGVRAARKALRDRWQAFVDTTKRDYGVLAGVGHEARLAGAAGLSSALQAFDTAATSPPTTAAAAQKVRERLEALRTAVRDLGLEGEAGRFMVAAAEGRADPRDLYKPAVIAFLDSHPGVWDLLRVKL
ncbi:hypothetical protein [Methylobacterium sp. CM6244]